MTDYLKELFNDELYKIELNLNNSIFYCYEEENGEWIELNNFSDYPKAKKYLEERDKRKQSGKLKKANPIECYHVGYNNELKEVKITSIDVSGTYFGLYVWVSTGKSRNKESLYNLYKRSEKNTKIFEDISDLRKQIELLEKQREKFTEEEIKKHFQEGGE